MRAAGAFGTPPQEPDEACGYAGSILSPSAEGSITLTSVTATSVSGSFTFEDGLGGTHSGSFTAPVCARGPGRRCCYEP